MHQHPYQHPHQHPRYRSQQACAVSSFFFVCFEMFCFLRLCVRFQTAIATTTATTTETTRATTNIPSYLPSHLPTHLPSDPPSHFPISTYYVSTKSRGVSAGHGTENHSDDHDTNVLESESVVIVLIVVCFCLILSCMILLYFDRRHKRNVKLKQQETVQTIWGPSMSDGDDNDILRDCDHNSGNIEMNDPNAGCDTEGLVTMNDAVANR